MTPTLIEFFKGFFIEKGACLMINFTFKMNMAVKKVRVQIFLKVKSTF